MDPLTMALLAGGASAVGALPDIIPSKFEREQKRRLQGLQRQQELGTLGLTPEERALMAEQYEGLTQQAGDQQRALMEQYSSLQGTPAGAAVAMQQAGQQTRQLAAAQARDVARADLAKAAAQEQEILDLQAAQGEMAQARREAMVAPIEAGTSAYLQGKTLETLAGTGAGMDAARAQSQQIAKYMEQYGLTKEEATQLYGEFDVNDMFYMGL
jgi:hypothetical protein